MNDYDEIMGEDSYLEAQYEDRTQYECDYNDNDLAWCPDDWDEDE